MQYVIVKPLSGWCPRLGADVTSAESAGYIPGTVFVSTTKQLDDVTDMEVLDLVRGRKPVGHSTQGDSVYEVSDDEAAALARLHDERASAKEAARKAEHEAIMTRAADPEWQAAQAERRRKAREFDQIFNEGGDGYNPYR